MPKITHENDGLIFNPLDDVSISPVQDTCVGSGNKATPMYACECALHVVCVAICRRPVFRTAQVEASQSQHCGL